MPYVVSDIALVTPHLIKYACKASRNLVQSPSWECNLAASENPGSPTTRICGSSGDSGPLKHQRPEVERLSEWRVGVGSE